MGCANIVARSFIYLLGLLCEYSLLVLSVGISQVNMINFTTSSFILSLS